MFISHFSSFSVFLVLLHVYKFVFLIFREFSVFSPWSRSYSVPFPFSTFLSVSRHIPGQTVFVSHFPRFSVFSPYSRSNSVFVSFFTFFSFLAIFHVLECEFLIFHVFQFSRHNPGSIVCISHFSRFSVFLAIF